MKRRRLPGWAQQLLQDRPGCDLYAHERRPGSGESLVETGYNVQLGTEGQFVVGYSVHNQSSDLVTLIPHLKKLKRLPKNMVADAAYGSEENYAYLEEHQIRISELEESLSYQLTGQNIDVLLQFRETVSLGLCNPTPDDKRRSLEILQVSVTVTNGIVVVTCRFGGNRCSFMLLKLTNLKKTCIIKPIRKDTNSLTSAALRPGCTKLWI